jgi:hypothetical protein
MAFLLDKYYFDAVAADGRCFIGYSAQLSWGLLRLPFHGGIWCSKDGAVQTSERYFRQPGPVEDGATTTWRTPKGEGLWTGPQRGISRSLYEGSSGNIQWDLLKDRAEVVLNDGLFGGFKGSGYTERLRMRIAPWRLPIRALHWGRFHGQLTTVVWIRWEGPAPLTLILVNGVEQADGVVEAHGLRVGGRTLAFSESRVLRDGTLRNNLFGRSRWPAWVFPQSGLSVLERKCISHGTLRGEGADETGWVVHELVTWP